MRALLKSLDEKMWPFVVLGWTKPTRVIAEWSAVQLVVASYNIKALNEISMLSPNYH